MKKIKKKIKPIKLFGMLTLSCLGCLAYVSPVEWVQASKSVATHIGTFEGSTIFVTSSSNGINPGLFIEVMDEDGNLTQYESEEGVITIPDTKEGAYITQAKLLGKTRYLDEDTGEILDTWEEGRNLRLVSVENPVLTTTGKNLFDVNDSNNLGASISKEGETLTSITTCPVVFGYNGLDSTKQYTISFDIHKNSNGSPNSLMYSLSDKNVSYTTAENSYNITLKGNYTTGVTTREKVTIKGKREVWVQAGGDVTFSNIQIEEGSVATSYEPYQSNVLTVNEEVTLRGIGDVRDELNLLTGEKTEHVGYVDINSFVNAPSYRTLSDNAGYMAVLALENKKTTTNLMSNLVPVNTLNHANFGIYNNPANVVVFKKGCTREELELIVNQINIVYEFETPTIKTVALNSTYFFKPINKDSIEINGLIEPIMASITIPTDSLSFVLNPNEEAGQQFIAPEFSLINESLAPIQLELKSFNQITDVLNDVLPEAYESWEGLNQDQSKDIALALVPKEGEGWLSLHEGPRYVADTSNDFIGTVKGKSTVGFSFEALHGQAFKEALTPQYQLMFVFELAS